jgi:hypothetical protein
LARKKAKEKRTLVKWPALKKSLRLAGEIQQKHVRSTFVTSFPSVSHDREDHDFDLTEEFGEMPPIPDEWTPSAASTQRQPLLARSELGLNA